MKRAEPVLMHISMLCYWACIFINWVSAIRVVPQSLI